MVDRTEQRLPGGSSKREINYIQKEPDPRLFVKLREECGWGTVSVDSAEVAIRNSLYFICAEFQGNTIGFGRVVGDSALNYYIQDLIVEPEFRGCAVGFNILDKLLECIRRDSTSGATIGLMAAVGKEEFYLMHGFCVRPSNRYGAGMTMVI